MPPQDLKPSDSSRALLELLKIDRASEWLSAAAVEVGQKLHRTELWRYSTGRVTPHADRAALIEDLTDGRVLANGWRESEASVSATFAAASNGNGSPAATGTDDAKAGR